jgi:hypothetical protein
MATRDCGECTACCRGWLSTTIEGVRVLPGKPCHHSTASGCSIYERRPEHPCRSFNCAWLEDNSPLADDMRPDRCGAIVVFNRSWARHRIILAIPTGAEMPKETLDRVMALARAQKTPMLFVKNVFSDNGEYLGFKNNGYGPPWFVELVKNSVTDEDIFRL